MHQEDVFKIRAYIGLYRKREESEGFNASDRSLTLWIREEHKEFKPRVATSLYGRFDNVVLVDATSLSALHAAVQDLGSKEGIRETETFVAHELPNHPDWLSRLPTGFDENHISTEIAVLGLSVELGNYSAKEKAKLNFVKQKRTTQENKSNDVVDFLLSFGNVLAANAVFGEIDVLCLISKGEAETINEACHEVVGKCIEEKEVVLKTSLLLPCPLLKFD